MNSDCRHSHTRRNLQARLRSECWWRSDPCSTRTRPRGSLMAGIWVGDMRRCAARCDALGESSSRTVGASRAGKPLVGHVSPRHRCPLSLKLRMTADPRLRPRAAVRRATTGATEWGTGCLSIRGDDHPRNTSWDGSLGRASLQASLTTRLLDADVDRIGLTWVLSRRSSPSANPRASWDAPRRTGLRMLLMRSTSNLTPSSGRSSGEGLVGRCGVRDGDTGNLR